MRKLVTVLIILSLVCSLGCATKKLGAPQDAIQADEGAGAKHEILVEPPEGYPAGVPFVPGGETYQPSESFEKYEVVQSVDHFLLKYQISATELIRALEAKIDPAWRIEREQEDLFGILITRITLSDGKRLVQLSIIPYGASTILLVACGEFTHD